MQKGRSDVKAEVYQPDRLEFIDPYAITWQIAVKPTFRTAGDFADRWISIEGFQMIGNGNDRRNP
jgi:hypothetical protein